MRIAVALFSRVTNDCPRLTAATVRPVERSAGGAALCGASGAGPFAELGSADWGSCGELQVVGELGGLQTAAVDVDLVDRERGRVAERELAADDLAGGGVRLEDARCSRCTASAASLRW